MKVKATKKQHRHHETIHCLAARINFYIQNQHTINESSNPL